MGPNLQDHVSAVFFLAFLLFSWTTASIMSGALIERVRLSAYLILTALLGSVVWIMDAAWGWSSGGWLTTRFGFHDAIASLVVHGVAGAFTLGVLLNLGPRIGKYDVDGARETFRGHNTHLTLMGLMLIFTGFYGFYAACLVIQSTVFPGWLNIYLSPTTLGAIAFVITFGFAGGFTGGWFASKGDPFWTLSGGLAGVISVSAGADVYHPSLAYLLSISGGMVAVWAGGVIEKKLRVDDAVGAVAVHGVCGFYGVLLVGIFAGGYPTGVNNIPIVLRRPAHGNAGVPAARLPSRLLRQLDPQEDEPPARPARGRARGPRPRRVRAGLLPRVRACARDHRRARRPRGRGRAGAARGVLADERHAATEPRRSQRKGARRCSTRSRSTSGATTITEFWTFGGAGSTGTWILTVLGFSVMLVAFWGFVSLENRKLDRAGRPRCGASGALDRTRRQGVGGRDRWPSKQIDFPPLQKEDPWRRAVHARALARLHRDRRRHPAHGPRGAFHRPLGVTTLRRWRSTSTA